VNELNTSAGGVRPKHRDKGKCVLSIEVKKKKNV
jgi:hypothetical protein